MIRIAAVLLLFQSLAFTQYYSQVNQDRYINETFVKNSRNGVFLDVGAHDGICFSNTYFYEKELGWTGICIEPNPEVFALLKKNRTCTCVFGAGTSGPEVKKSFLKISGHSDMLSGLVDYLEPKHRQFIERELQQHGGSYEVIDVNCYNLNKILENAGIKHIDLLSLDTEGGEFEILKNFDFSKCQIDIITVEDNYHTFPFVQMMKKKGFKLDKALGQDLVFVYNNPDKNHYLW